MARQYSRIASVESRAPHASTSQRSRPLRDSDAGSSSHPRKRSHRIPRLVKNNLALGDAAQSHLRAFGFNNIAVAASILERRNLRPSSSFRRRTKLNRLLRLFSKPVAWCQPPCDEGGIIPAARQVAALSTSWLPNRTSRHLRRHIWLSNSFRGVQRARSPGERTRLAQPRLGQRSPAEGLPPSVHDEAP